ncbi:MAG TPA: HlyD family efflux transporter periplasmic adaptor subunit [Vicinamibacterales bacterium]|nr:HlyD family efflux transporter periplasmic adaptor subunit [Vicinamibacterales bacterium]
MDIQRPASVAQAKKRKQYMLGAIAVIIVVAVSVGLSQLRPAAPTVERATVWVDTVKRGPMVRQVRGLGTLVPVDEARRWVPASTQGRVERIVLRPGVQVTPDTVILELSDPNVQQALNDAEQQLRAAEADYNSLKARLDAEALNQRAAYAVVEAEYKNAQTEKDMNEGLAKEGLVSNLVLQQSLVRAQSAATRYKIEGERLKVNETSAAAQLMSAQASIDQRRSTYNLRRQQVDLLRVRAGMTGVLEQVPVEVGQQVQPGTNLVRVADPTRLKAELRIAETQARDLTIGQIAAVDTRQGIIPGKVSRIDPSAVNGTVTVDVALEGELPRGARPDLSVDGTIELERLENVLFVGRPAFGQEQSTVGLFKLNPDTGEAERAQVQLGRSSVNTIEVLNGLAEGDQVVLSDMSAWDQFERIRLR